MRIIAAILVTAFFLVESNAQVEISGAFQKDTVVIGDQVSFSLNLETNEDVEILGVATFFLDSIYSALETQKNITDTTQPVIPMIGDFELIDSSGWHDINKDGIYSGDELEWQVAQAGNKKIYRQEFTIRLWDPGPSVVLYPTVIYQQGDKQEVATNRDQMQVFVAPPKGIPVVQDSIQLAPNKTINEEPIKLSDFTSLFIIIGLTLLAGLIYLYFTKYYKSKDVVPSTFEEEKIIIPPHQLALSKLSELREKELWQQGDIKTYQSELTYIIREYLEGRYGIAALETTTDVIIHQIVDKIAHQGHTVALKEILQVADLVKFAKAKPSENLHESFMNKAEDFVNDTKYQTVPNLEAELEEE